MVETRRKRKEVEEKSTQRQSKRQKDEELFQNFFSEDEETDEEEEDFGQFKPNQQKKYIVRNKYFPIYADSPGHYQADTMMIRALKKVDGKMVEISIPYLIMMHINFRVAFIAPYPTNVKRDNDPSYGSRKKKMYIAVDSKNALKAFKEIQNEEIPDLISAAQEKMDKVPNDILNIKTVQVDEGGEFQKEFRAYLRAEGIHEYVIKPSETSKRGMGIIERLVRTLRQDVDRFRKSRGDFRHDWKKGRPKYSKKAVEKSQSLLPVEQLTALLRKAVDYYNQKAPHRYVRKMKRYINNKTTNKNLKEGTPITPFSLLRNGRVNETKIIEFQQKITKLRGDYWKERVNKILKDGGNPIKWPDKLKAFDKVTSKSIGSRKTGGDIHTYQKRHRGPSLAVHAGLGNNPLVTDRRQDGSLRLNSGTGRSLGFDDSDYRYLPYDFFLPEDNQSIEKRRRENKIRRGRGSKYPDYEAWKRQKAAQKEQRSRQRGKKQKKKKT